MDGAPNGGHDTMERKIISINMPVELLEDIQEHAEELGLSTSAYIRMAAAKACRAE